MNTTNHMATGAIIALTVKEPALVLPLAFLSHFVLDAVPHFGYEGGFGDALKHKLTYPMLGLDAIGVVLLAFIVPGSLLVWLAMLVAFSPDLVWFVRYYFFERKGIFEPHERLDPLSKIHSKIQWFEKPIGLIVELILAVILLYYVNILTFN